MSRGALRPSTVREVKKTEQRRPIGESPLTSLSVCKMRRSKTPDRTENALMSGDGVMRGRCRGEGMRRGRSSHQSRVIIDEGEMRRRCR